MVKTAQSKFRIYTPQEDHLQYWKDIYINEEVVDDQHPDSVKKINRLLQRFLEFFEKRYGHQKVTAVTKRDVEAWLDFLYAKKEEGGAGYSPNYVNDHQTVLSQFLKWVRIKAPHLIMKDPTYKVRDIYVGEPKGRALTAQQLLTLKNICERLERFHLKRDRHRASGKMILRENSRPLRDRAIVYVLLSTGLRREELTKLDLDQLQPNEPKLLRKNAQAKIVEVKGKGKTVRTVYLSEDARHALADYLEQERVRDVLPGLQVLFLSAAGATNRTKNGRLSPRTINSILERIGRWHDAEQSDPDRKISPFQPHDCRHTFANELKKSPGVTDQDLMNLMGWRNPKQIVRYTKEKDEVYSGFIQKF